MAEGPESGARKRRGFVDEAWSFVGSISFAVSVLIAIALASVVGTVVPQNPVADHTQAMELLRSAEREWGPLKARLYYYTHSYDVWHAWWYQALLILLLASACVCTADRIEGTLRRWRRPRVTADPRVFRTLKAGRTLRLEDSVASGAERARKALAHRGLRVREEADGEARCLLGRRGAVSVVGPLLVHASLVVILGAAVWGTHPKLGKAHGDLPILEGGLAYDPISEAYVALDDFEIRYSYEDMPGKPGVTSASPVDYISRVAFYREAEGAGDLAVRVIAGKEGELPLVLREGDPILSGRMGTIGEKKRLSLERRGVIEVNHPGKSGGADFYQSSWRLLGCQLEVRDAGGQSGTVSVRVDPNEVDRSGSDWQPEPVALPIAVSPPAGEGGDPPTVSIVPTRFLPRFERGRALPASARTAPALALELSRVTERPGAEPEVESLGVIEQGGSMAFGETTVTLLGPSYATVLEVRRFPGLWLLMTGFAIAGLGLVLSFWVPLREVRVRVEEQGEGCAVSLGMPRSYPYEDADVIVDAIAAELGGKRLGSAAGAKRPDAGGKEGRTRGR